MQEKIWYIVPFFLLGILFIISGLAETNRPPFDLPEAEAELVAGYNVEYSSMGFASFFLAEYLNIITFNIITIIIFFGAWNLGGIILIIKSVIFCIISVWIRGSVPRYRYDQLMRLGWKILLPEALGFTLFYLGIFWFLVFYW